MRGQSVFLLFMEMMNFKPTSLLIKQTDRVLWFPMYVEPEHEVMGKVQLSISYSASGEFGDSKVCLKPPNVIKKCLSLPIDLYMYYTIARIRGYRIGGCYMSPQEGWYMA